MKTVHIYDDVHTEAKAAAAARRRTLPNFTSELLAAALVLLNEKRIEIPALDPESEATLATSAVP